MAEDVFEALSHEIRRKIILLLNTPKTFTDLQRETNLESSALAFHLKKLGNLIKKNEQGYYELTDLGWKAYEIIQVLTQSNQNININNLIINNKPKPNLSRRLSEKINGALANLLGAIGESIGEALSNIDIKAEELLVEVYNGPLKVLPNLEVNLDGGIVKISQGEPYAVIRCKNREDLEISEIKDTLEINMDGCKADINYSPLNRLEINIDGGLLNVNNNAQILEINIDGGSAKLNISSLTKSSLSMDGGIIKGTLGYIGQGSLDIDIDGGSVKLELCLPQGIGIIANNKINGGKVDVPTIIGEKGFITVNSYVNGGFVYITKSNC
ncbi:MAG: winged helix-turn-helix domain-containing protein [Saccharolobus sp.]|jgi:DNA-binding HxlR family transcriptional regulator|uniref:ArsR/SmtB family transcription factor n=1 Tax=Saccharolobus sp. TaxID=2100761 RepID=UPI0028CE30B1|nr:winged helix-turn-helix domain-containing protein [Saccharolobus sp.]MDT7861589.1 winged helix-turn-helix domain-containing protein [Saccharolobus sp.]